MFIVIAGAGNVGRQLAANLLREKHTVVLLDRRPEVCGQMVRLFSEALVICGDGCAPDVLEQACLRRADVVAALTGDDEDNIVICQLAKERFNVRRTVAKVNNSRNAQTFAALGVDVPVDSGAIITGLITQEISSSEMSTLFTLKRGKMAIVQVTVSSCSPVVSKKVMELVLPKDTVLISILRGEDVLVPRGQTVLQHGDDVIALTSDDSRQVLLDLLGAKE
ncbi:potassium transport systems NAD-binding protein [Candidatus Termititenax persephonae]|uniref:Trk system potassium uptake protein TrkA n=1 Tax=Candidatus Termititenax persephonae TaxID=2218525 RepID=A0A388TJI2_9BACT|nr:potassium transport systems NAD-binding protein [Candidatus Termititenax persephonae]